MQKRTREIIALVILLALLVGGICGVAWYLLVGHNWNAAASLIDDRIGTMEGYTVVLCEGAAPHSEADLDEGGGFVRKVAGIPDSLKEKGFGFLLEGRTTAAQAARAYQGKDAQTVTVDIENAASYKDPVIIPRNGKRIAVYYVEGPHQELASRLALRSLKKYEVDSTICIFDDADAMEFGLGNVTMAICLDRTAHMDGEYIGGTFIVSAPRYGQVKAVLVAPSGFMSTKTIDEL